MKTITFSEFLAVALIAIIAIIKWVAIGFGVWWIGHSITHACPAEAAPLKNQNIIAVWVRAGF